MDLQSLYEEYNRAPAFVFMTSQPKRALLFELMEKEFGYLPRRVLSALFRNGILCRAQVNAITDAELGRLPHIGTRGAEVLRKAFPYEPGVSAVIAERDTILWFRSLSPTTQDAIRRFYLAALQEITTADD